MTNLERINRINELEAKEEKADSSGKNFSIKDRRELDELRDINNSLRDQSIPRPTCCKPIQECSVILSFPGVDKDDSWEYNLDVCNWQIREHKLPCSGQYGSLMRKDYNKPYPKFCPFCGTPLPRLVKRDKKDCKQFGKISNPHDGYCKTCGEREIGCNCFPPQAAWKIVETIHSLPAYSFVLVLDGVDHIDSKMEERLCALCSDALLSSSGGKVQLDFDRWAQTKELAIKSAIADIEEAGYAVVKPKRTIRILR